jgi:hypothetical protein
MSVYLQASRVTVTRTHRQEQKKVTVTCRRQLRAETQAPTEKKGGKLQQPAHAAKPAPQKKKDA